MYSVKYLYEKPADQLDKPWVFLRPPYQSVYSQEEIDSIIIPFRNNLENLSGYLPPVIEEIDQSKLTFTWSSEQTDFLIFIHGLIRITDPQNLFYPAMNLLRQRRQSLGITYNVTRTGPNLV